MQCHAGRGQGSSRECRSDGLQRQQLLMRLRRRNRRWRLQIAVHERRGRPAKTPIPVKAQEASTRHASSHQQYSSTQPNLQRIMPAEPKAAPAVLEHKTKPTTFHARRVKSSQPSRGSKPPVQYIIKPTTFHARRAESSQLSRRTKPPLHCASLWPVPVRGPEMLLPFS